MLSHPKIPDGVTIFSDLPKKGEPYAIYIECVIDGGVYSYRRYTLEPEMGYGYHIDVNMMVLIEVVAIFASELRSLYQELERFDREVFEWARDLL
ncbi:hypothetical protein HWD32_gp69 [Gordonia phage Secretariat]|uniref:Uncharacterized protein n=1 Tax=Gordonia phage Secretariat TaxID=2725616 RepID=A0A6M3T9Q9_9CAUD|nr:hypothetical protein HWD32_gp69 [Gordonia phage Secretariat]QJD49644.1 hypothetical protein SEA_SECRETARIAT_69 [Gordonia phage Secretariat]